MKVNKKKISLQSLRFYCSLRGNHECKFCLLSKYNNINITGDFLLG